MPSKRKAGSVTRSLGARGGSNTKKRRWEKKLDPNNLYIAAGKQAEEDKNPLKFDVGKGLPMLVHHPILVM